MSGDGELRDASKARRHRVRLLRSTIWLLALLAVPTVSTADSIIERAEVQTSTRGSILRFEFVAPIRYVNHTPLRRSAEVDIVLRAVNREDFDLDALRGRESRGLDPDGASPFRAYRYDGSTDQGARLSVSFRTIVDYEIRTAPDLRTLVVVVRPAGSTTAARQETKPVARSQSGYVIHLLSQLQAIDLDSVPKRPEFEGLTLFETTAVVKGRTWYRLNLGPFATRAEANRVLQRVRKRYRDAWISRKKQRVPVVAAASAREAPAAADTLAARIAKMMERARGAMTAGQYDLAIRLYTEVIERSSAGADREARELLGLARERNGQYAHARAEYEAYLRLYPQGEDAERVRQRLAGVLTVRPTRVERSPSGSRRAARREASWNWSGSLSQYYFRNDRIAAELVQDESTLHSDLLTWFTVTGRRRGPRFDMRLQAALSNDRDLLSDDDADRIVPTDLYVDVLDKRSGISGRLGRQTLAGSGAQGRFDGLVAGYRATPTLQLNLMRGFPVDLNNKTEVQQDKPFTGLNAQFGPYAEHWNFAAYAIEQRNDEITDRSAVGFETRYFSPRQSYFLQLDHDVYFDELNSVLLLANWKLPADSTLYLTLDQRLSPTLSSSNALQGQPVSEMSELLQIFTAEQIRVLARDRTADTRTVSVGGTHRLPSELQASVDITVSETGATPASGGVGATDATGTEVFYSVQLLGDDFIFPLGTTLLSLRYSDTSLSQLYGAVLDYRRVLKAQWRMVPRLELEHRRRNDNDDTSTRLAPTLGFEYRGWRRGEFEVEAGLDWERSSSADGSDDTTEMTFTIGYRWDF